MLLLLVAILLGICCGIVTGLTPGVHINLVSTILLSLSPLLVKHVPLLYVCALIMGMAITHNFLDTIPSVFLGAPDDKNALGVLPGHRYLLNGNGLMAVKLSLIGGVLGAVLSVIAFLPVLLLVRAIAELMKPYLFWVMLSIILFMILKDKKPTIAAIIFVLSGMLGLITLSIPIDEPLLPLLSGMFGIATLLYSINENQVIPPQRDECYTEIDKQKTIIGSTMGLAGGFLTALLPGVSASAASAITSQGSKIGDHGFLVLLGSLGTASFILSLAAYVAIEKARNGAMVVIVKLSAMTPATIFLLLCVALIAAGIASLIALSFARGAALWLPKMPYRRLCIAVIMFIILIVYLRTGWLGSLILLTSTAIGMLPAALKTARGQAMGCLLLPLLVFLYA